VIAVADLPWPRWFVGLFFGALLSAPSALITKAWRPIMAFGVVGGVIIGLLVSRIAR